MLHGLTAILPNIENWVGKGKKKTHQNEELDSAVQLLQLKKARGQEITSLEQKAQGIPWSSK